MNISFNIPDDTGADFILAAHWKISNPDLTDEQVMKKHLKRCIGLLIDEYKKDQVLSADRAAVKQMQRELLDAQQALVVKVRDYDTNTTPTEISDP